MPRVNGIVETCLHVDNLEISAQFYENLFGFRRMVSDTRFCAFDAGPRSVFLLFLRGGTLEPVKIAGGLVPPHNSSGNLHLAFAIDPGDLDAWENRLKQAGVAVESRVHWESGGRSLYFRDPDGHLVELATPGTWPNY